MIEEIIKDIDIETSFVELLEYEYNIELKKQLNKRLTDTEYFFDKYCIKPSILLTIIKKRCKNEKNNSN